MSYEGFEDLSLWQKAAALYQGPEELVENEVFKATRWFRDQPDSAALSVSNDIAASCTRQLRGWADFTKAFWARVIRARPGG